MKTLITDHRVLAGMERAGFIIRDGKPGDTTRHWTGARAKVVTVDAGPKLKHWGEVFDYKGKPYQIRYFDGCMSPFVCYVGIGRQFPAFV